MCRRRKIRCNRETPCGNCIRSKNDSCVYESHLGLPSRQLGNDSGDGFSIAADSAANSGLDLEFLKGRIRQLEDHLQKVANHTTPLLPLTPSSVATPVSSVVTAESRIGGVFYIHHGDPALGQSPSMHRSITHKNRMYGQSHWMNLSIVLVKDIAEIIDTQVRNESTKCLAEKVFAGMHKCKQIAKAIKTQRAPSWPCPPTPHLPTKDVADVLLDCYLRTIESVYRIIHIPSFQREYDTVWVAGAEADKVFLIQLKLIFAIGAATYDEKFTLRSTALRWVYEAQTWLANPALKHRLGIPYLQIYCLLLISRECVALDEDLIFISAGGLLRAAIYLGLHRDPVHLPCRTRYANEMHRRLWNTIIEVYLQSSINSGSPPLICLDDFDTQPPSNFDDEQLTIDDDVEPATENKFTDVSVQIALRQTFPIRLALTRFLNNFKSSGTYAETLRVDSELRATYKVLRSKLREFSLMAGKSPSGFQLRTVDVIMHRYLCTLHSPFYLSSLQDTSYAFSRKTVIDSALKIWYASNSSSATMGIQAFGDIIPSEREHNDFERFITCATGFLRSATMQSVLMVGVEMKNLLQEDDGLGLSPPRQDLLVILEHAKSWSLKCIEAGETNIKGYIFTCLMYAYVESHARGLDKHGAGAVLIEAVRNAEELCMAILERSLEQEPLEKSLGETVNMPLGFNPEITQGWESFVSRVMLSWNFYLPSRSIDDIKRNYGSFQV